MTECIQTRFGFARHFKREIVGEFSGGTMTSDAGALLLREADLRMNLLARFSQCFLDGRHPDLIEHSVEQMLAQRVYALALGYEDLNDHELLRNDPLLRMLAGKAEPDKEALAGKSTLNRLELGEPYAAKARTRSRRTVPPPPSLHPPQKCGRGARIPPGL